MNPVAIYRQATGREDAEEVVKQRVIDKTEKQKEIISWSSWLTHPITKEFFADLEGRVSELDNAARELALNYHNNKNHDAIIASLIQSATLRKVKENAEQKSVTPQP